MYLIASLIGLGVATGTTCDMNSYCRSRAGPLSYCKNWLTVTSCSGADQVINCATCGVSSTPTTTPKAASSTTLVGRSTSTPRPVTTSPAPTTARPTTVAPTATSRTTRPTTAAPTTTRTTSRPTTAAPTTTRTTTRPTTVAPTTTRTTSIPTTVAPTTTGTTTVTPTTRVISQPPETSSSTTRTTASTTTTVRQVVTAAAPPTIETSECEALPVYQAPLFLWVEMPNSKIPSEFQAYFQRLKSFLESNCVNMLTTTIVVRVVSPYYPSANPMFWPPATSPLFTELISKLSLPKGSKVKVLLYPYVMEDGDRINWVKFANTNGVTPVVLGEASNVTSTDSNITTNETTTTTTTPPPSNTVYDGIFHYTREWQKFVDESTVPSAVIDGFMLDYEEISKIMGTKHMITLTPESFGPYRAAYPTVKTGTSVGYDSGRFIRGFDPIMDYLHLQVYDFYYPYAGADKSLTDSLFEVYRDNAPALIDSIMKNVLTKTVLNAYMGRESKVKLMWSTQTLFEGGCIYPMRDGKCGLNYEFNWSPAQFNQFAQMVQAHPVLGKFEHGIYTYNFMRSDWLTKSTRTQASR